MVRLCGAPKVDLDKTQRLERRLGKGDPQFVGGKDGFLEDVIPDFSALDFILLGEETGVGMSYVYSG
jgi:hypothetical protein